MTNVIDLSARREFAEPPPYQWTAEELRARYAYSLHVLPFVGRKPGKPFDRPVTWWNDEPGVDHRLDYKRGRAYAAMLLDALAADKCGHHPVESIFAAIVEDAVRRNIKGGKHSRTLPPAVDGFLWELSKFIVTATERGVPHGAA